MEDTLIYIFLDVDGVLNDEQYIIKCFEKHHKPMHMNRVPFDPNCLNNLRVLTELIEEQNYIVRIILSSSWRLSDIDTEVVKARLAEYGLSIFSKTERMNGRRGEEIKDYLDRNDPCKSFIILDDEAFDIKELYPNNLVLTNFNEGFNKDCLKSALSIVLDLNNIKNLDERINEKWIS